MIRKRLLSACLALALCLSLLPATALAVDGDTETARPATLVVGNINVITSQDGYWTTNSTTGGLTKPSEAESWNVHYDEGTNTLYLNGATITASSDSNNNTSNAGIYATASEGQSVSLNIVLQGENNKVSGDIGIYVYSSSTGIARLTISSEDGSNLTASGTVNPGIRVQSNGGDATLTIRNADVEAKVTTSGSIGVTVQAGSSSSASLTVEGGSLTASGRKGIHFPEESPQLNIRESAIVRASGGIAAGINEDDPVTPSGVGIVFNDKVGTVYGSVTLEENLTIGEGESLTLDDGASLNAGGHNVIVDGGTLDDSIKNSLGDSVKYTPTITTTTLTDGTVGTSYSQTLTATGTAPITWSIAEGSSLPTGLSLNGNTISGTPTTAGTYSFTVTASNSGGSDSEQLSITISSATNIPVESVSLDKANLELTEGETAQLTATVLPDKATNKNVTWSTSNASIATVDANGEVTAVSAGTATITATADGKSATCTVTVTADTVPVTGVSLNKTSTSLYVGDTETLTATVQPGNASNQTVTWSTSDASVATVENGVVRATGRGTATITVTTVDGSFTADCTVTVSRYSTGGGPTTYAVTAPDVENGTVRVSPSRASRGTTVTITVTPDEGYELESLTVLDSRDNEITLTDKGDGKYTFTMPSGRVTVEASFAEIAPEPLPFGDVDDGDWFADAVRFVYENGMMNGVSETYFAPHATTSRSMIVTILYRLEGEPVVDDAMDFTDVAGDAYYAEAVRWAASEGIVGGYGGGLFGSDDAVTREQLAVILYRYAVYKGYDVSIGEDTNILSYADFADLSEYAIPAMQWACGAGVITGVTDATLVPQGEATRAQVAAMLMRFCEAIG